MAATGFDGPILRVSVVIYVREFDALSAGEYKYLFVGYCDFVDRSCEVFCSNANRLGQDACTLEFGFHHGDGSVFMSNTSISARRSRGGGGFSARQVVM